MADAVDDRLIPIPEAVKALGVCARTVEKLAEQGILPKVYIFGSVRYRLSDVQRLIREGTPRRRAA